MSVSTATTAIETRTGEFLVIHLRDERGRLEPIGVILLDRAADQLYVRCRRDWQEFAAEEADVLELLEDDLLKAFRDMGAASFLRWLDSASNELSVGDLESVMMLRPERTLADLYRRHVATTVQPYRTHLPLYSARAAATKFSEQQTVEDTGDWLEVPVGLKLDANMFIARVEGRSMEPRIPSGSLCVFRRGVTGSRQGRLVLVENRSASETERYTIKQYWSEKRAAEDGWSHARILLKPLNPEFESWELDESGAYEVLAEFVAVLDE